MIRCNQCGHVLKETKGKYCPQCGDPYEDEVRERAKKAYAYQKNLYIAIGIVAALILVASFIFIYTSRHYSWKEDVTGYVSDKDHYTTQRCVASNKYGCTWYTTDHHYVLVIIGNHTTHREYVDQSLYDATAIGDLYTYQVEHYDWKPGMKDAPTPVWVVLVPAILAGICIPAYSAWVSLRRYKEVWEWKRTGDLTVGDEDEDTGHETYEGNKTLRDYGDSEE